MELQEGHHAVGPVAVPGHDVIVIDPDWGEPSEPLYACLECGLVSGDTHRFQVTECDRDQNPINKTLAESGRLAQRDT